MTFDAVLAQVCELLQHEGRVSYRALRRRFDLDEEYLEDVKAEIIQAKTYTLSGHVADAVSLLTRAMEQMARAMAGFQALCSLSLGEAQLLAGRLEEARVLAEGALAHARTHQERGNQAYALHLLGKIAMQCEPPERALAAAHYQRARAHAEALGMRPLQTHCHYGLGKLYLKTDRPEQARTELSAALALYRAMDMTFWLLQAEAALAQTE